MPEEYTINDLYVLIQQQIVMLDMKLSSIDAKLSSILVFLTAAFSMPKAATLVSEYYGNQDLDGNGLIFGKDFYITNPPKMLESIEFDTTPPSALTWEEFIA
jgi:hypothetical protein